MNIRKLILNPWNGFKKPLQKTVAKFKRNGYTKHISVAEPMEKKYKHLNFDYGFNRNDKRATAKATA